MIILIAHQKGGVGKSTLAVNLAAEAQTHSPDVLIVEADPTVRTAHNWTKTREDAGGKQITTVHLEGNIHAQLRDLGDRYDYVLVDVAGKDSREMRTAMTAADVMVAPMQPSQPDMDAAHFLVLTIEQARDFNPDLSVLAVLSRVPTNNFSREAAQAAEYLEDYPELPLAETRIHERVVYRTAMEKGLGVVEMKDGKAKAEIQLLMAEIRKSAKRRL